MIVVGKGVTDWGDEDAGPSFSVARQSQRTPPQFQECICQQLKCAMHTKRVHSTPMKCN